MAGENISEEGVGELPNPSDQPGPAEESKVPTAALGPATPVGNGGHHAGGSGNNAAHVYGHDPASPPETADSPSPPPPPSPSARDTLSPTPSEQARKKAEMEDWASARASQDQASTRIASWVLHGDWPRALPPHSQNVAANDNDNDNDLPARPAELSISDEEEEKEEEEEEEEDDHVDRERKLRA